MFEWQSTSILHCSLSMMEMCTTLQVLQRNNA